MIVTVVPLMFMSLITMIRFSSQSVVVLAEFNSTSSLIIRRCHKTYTGWRSPTPVIKTNDFICLQCYQCFRKESYIQLDEIPALNQLWKGIWFVSKTWLNVSNDSPNFQFLITFSILLIIRNSLSETRKGFSSKYRLGYPQHDICDNFTEENMPLFVEAP